MKWPRRSDLRFDATFSRVPPADFAEKVGIPLGWIVVHHAHVPTKADRRKAHGEWFEISSDRGTIYRMLRFSPRLLKGNTTTPGQIVIDWIGWIDLHDRDEDVQSSILLKVRRLPWWNRPRAYLKHPDPAIRLSGWLGWTSVILGAIALLLTLLTLPYDWIGDQVGALLSFLAGLCGSRCTG